MLFVGFSLLVVRALRATDYKQARSAPAWLEIKLILVNFFFFCVKITTFADMKRFDYILFTLLLFVLLEFIYFCIIC